MKLVLRSGFHEALVVVSRILHLPSRAFSARGTQKFNYEGHLVPPPRLFLPPPPTLFSCAVLYDDAGDKAVEDKALGAMMDYLKEYIVLAGEAEPQAEDGHLVAEIKAGQADYCDYR